MAPWTTFAIWVDDINKRATDDQKRDNQTRGIDNWDLLGSIRIYFVASENERKREMPNVQSVPSVQSVQSMQSALTVPKISHLQNALRICKCAELFLLVSGACWSSLHRSFFHLIQPRQKIQHVCHRYVTSLSLHNTDISLHPLQTVYMSWFAASS